MSSEKQNLEQAIAALDAQRAVLGDAVVETALAPLRQKLAALEAQTAVPSRPQRKLVTVLFADISGFTSMSETMDPELVSQMINALWQRLDRAITRHGGTIDKHIGDAVMALFGVPIAREDAPEQAIRAALEMQSQLRDFTSTQRIEGVDQASLERLTMRIGINTGLVMLDTVGTTTEFTAIGDAVNVASRVETAAPLGGVLVSHDTYKHVRGLFTVQPQEPITVKGKSEPIQTYLVKGIRPRAFRVPTRGVVGVETRTIGREAELDELKNILRGVKQGAQVMTIVADAGTGKSRLLYEFTNWLDLQQEHVRVFKARATEDMAALPYSLIRDLFAFQFGIAEDDSAVVAREKLEQGLHEIIGAPSHEQAPFIGHLIGLDYSNNHHIEGILQDAKQIRDRAFHYVTQMFMQVMRDQPAAIFLEDIHWADDSSLDLIEHLVQECHSMPLLIVSLSRPTLYERRPTWGQDSTRYKRLNLPALSSENSNLLLDEILRKLPEIPDGLRDLIISRAEGNPFFVEEVVKMMIDDKIIEVGEETWNVNLDRLIQVRVPATLTGVLQTRLDGLPATERQMLQRASVVGRVFWDDALASLLEQSQQPPAEPQPELVGASLGNLQDKELVFRHSSSAFSHTDEYIFKHAILRDVTYESVLIQLRRIYHAQVAAWLAERSADRVGEFAGRIGEHHERAGDLLHAADWYARAGKQAKAAFAPETAASFYRKALDIWADNPDTTEEHVARSVEVLAELGDVLNWLGRFDEAYATFDQMRYIVEASGDLVGQARAWHGLAMVNFGAGNLPAALEGGIRAEELARAAGAQPELASALMVVGWARLRSGEPETALKLTEEAVAIAQSVGNKAQTASSLNFLGGVNFMLGRYGPAADALQEALKLFEDLDSRDKTLDLLNNLGVIAEAQGDYETALERYQKALQTALEIGKRNNALQYRSNVGGIRVKLGDYAEAENDLRAAIGMAESAKHHFLSETYRMLAEACLGQGKTDEALESAHRALELGKQFNALDTIAGAWRALGMVAAHLGQPVLVAAGSEDSCSASGCFDESLQIYTKLGMEGEQAWTLRAWAAHELEQGNRAQGEEMWNQAQEIFSRLGATLEAERMNTLPDGQ